MSSPVTHMNESSHRKAALHSIETFGSVDGPGIRFVVFLQGCSMRCQYCHNPDTWSMHSADMVSADELLDHALRYRAYWGKKGGITVSGGEPLLQTDFLIEFFKKAKEKDIHTVIDTSGHPFSRNEPYFGRFQTLMKYTDLLLVDIKQIDEEKHRALTCRSNTHTLDMLQYLSETGKPIWIRHVLIPGRTDFDTDLIRLDAYIRSLKNVQRVEVLPYHTMAIPKWEELRLPYPLAGIDPPSDERVANANRLLHTDSYTGWKN